MVFNESAQSDSIKIGFADDHNVVRKAIVGLINSFEGCQIAYEAKNGRELIDQIVQAGAPPDVCILDLYMPVLNGFDTLIELRKRYPDIKVLVLSTNVSDYLLEMMVKNGVNGYLVKDCESEELERAIKLIHENGIYSSKKLGHKFYMNMLSNKSRFPEFTEQEIELLKNCCSDLSYDEIATKMGTTMRSVDWSRNSLFKKLKVASRSSLVMFAIQSGLVELNIDTTGRSMVIKKQKP